jgi:hypothetical protein
MSYIFLTAALIFFLSALRSTMKTRVLLSSIFIADSVVSVRINRRLFCRSTVPSSLLPINRRGDVRNACSHSSPAVALLNQNELARRTMNVVWVVLRSTSFCFFHYIWGRREYMPALRPQRPSHPPPSPCSRTTQCRTTRTQRHDVHAVHAQSASCGSGQTPRLALYLAGKKETKTTNI